ncbi:MAG TPA: aldo/keto reductase [Spirochaetia bacterium]|nr:aldo/keto reductase [Spirochaetia bacterium]
MKTRSLGANGPEVSAVGLGCMAMSGTYGPVDDGESIATIHEAIERGVTLLDTGDFYGRGHNELLLREALKGGKRDRVFLQVKFGAQLEPSGRFIGFDGRPASVKTFLTYSLTRLGTDHVDLYQPSRLDPRVPIEETVGAVAEMVKAGYVRFIGLSEMGVATIRRAHAVHPITALQIEYSLMSRGMEKDILPAVRKLGIGVTAYGILSRGLMARVDPPESGKSDIRSRFPRFQEQNLGRNLRLVQALAAVAKKKGTTTAQLACAWVLSRGEDIVPLLGARNRTQLRDSLGALELSLSAADLEEIERAVPASEIAGGRYDEAALSILDSELPKTQPGE